MNKNMSKKSFESNNTISILATVNKFAVLRGERPKIEHEKKNEKKNEKKHDNKPTKNKKNVQIKNEQSIDTFKKEKQKVIEKSFDKTDETDENVKKNDDYIPEQKAIYINTLDNLNEMGDTMFLNSSWTVWIHKAECDVWTENSYALIDHINSIGSFWRFFNNFHAFDKIRNQIFIMRNKIKPIWEDNDNRNGGICSIKLDCYSKQGRIDVSVEIMICICLLVMNETLIQAHDEINGVSYSIKNRSVLIKIWCKNFINKIAEKLPIELLNKLDSMMKNMNKDKVYLNKKIKTQGQSNNISIRYTQIKPEYDITE